MSIQKRVIICNGPPGNGRDNILSELKEIASFGYHHLFEYIVEEAKLENTNLTKINILDFYDSQPEKMETYRLKALEKINNMINSDGGVHIISTSVHFEWKGNRFQGLTEEDVHLLNPDMFILIFDDIVRVRDRLSEDIQWQDHKYTLGEIANWRREEVNGVYRLAESFTPKRNTQLVAYENGPELLRDLIYKPSKETVYLSHPITGEGPDFFKKIDKFLDSLSEYYVLYDPYLIKDWDIVEQWRDAVNETIDADQELPDTFTFRMTYRDGPMEAEFDIREVETAIKNLRFQIIDSDYKIIENTDMVVVYHPRKSISAGVMCEMVYAKALAKLVYAYYPYEPSPFFEWYATRIFTNADEMRDFLIKESKMTGQRPLDYFSQPPAR
ncbi:MAG: AAA family ATPase [Candidatus Bathyarchaeota archaeon]|nr:AAA family ATPase [Candidatus Bathyarchaeota archaeon]